MEKSIQSPFPSLPPMAIAPEMQQTRPSLPRRRRTKRLALPVPKNCQSHVRFDACPVRTHTYGKNKILRPVPNQMDSPQMGCLEIAFLVPVPVCPRKKMLNATQDGMLQKGGKYSNHLHKLHLLGAIGSKTIWDMPCSPRCQFLLPWQIAQVAKEKFQKTKDCLLP